MKEGLKNVCLFVAIKFVSDFADVPAGFESQGKISPLPLQYLFHLFYRLSRSYKVRQIESPYIVTVRVKMSILAISIFLLLGPINALMFSIRYGVIGI